MSIRYLIRRSAIAGQWMIWDRFTKGPVLLGKRSLVGFTLDQAQSELENLLSQEPEHMSRWQLVQAGAILIECQDESDAREKAKLLFKRDPRLVARVLVDGLVVGQVEGRLLDQWIGQ